MFGFILSILLAVLFISPLALYISGKIMKVTDPKFTFVNCIWMAFVAGLIGGLLGRVHTALPFIISTLLLGFFLNKQYQFKTETIVPMLVLHFILNLAMYYFLIILVIGSVFKIGMML